MISSVPYVPPDTMKNVAATNGQSVSLAALFFGEVNTWEGTWAGTDMLLNSYDRPPERNLFSSLRWTSCVGKRIQGLHLHATRKYVFEEISCAISVSYLNIRPCSRRLSPVIDSLCFLPFKFLG